MANRAHWKNHAPVLRFETVEVDGANISNVTAHHAGNVKSLKLGKGAQVEIIRSGGVIPKTQIGHQNSPSRHLRPCPVCAVDVEWKNDFLYCTNHESCPAQAQTGLFYFLKRSKQRKGLVQNIGGSVENGCLHREYFCFERKGLPYRGWDKQSENLEKALQDSISTEVEDARFLQHLALKT